jgi:hypothetical protein
VERRIFQPAFTFFSRDGGVVFLQGVLQNCGGRVWCFCGQFVVKCVVNDGRLMVIFCYRKVRHNFQLYFCSLNWTFDRRSVEQPGWGDLPFNQASRGG